MPTMFEHLASSSQKLLSHVLSEVVYRASKQLGIGDLPLAGN